MAHPYVPYDPDLLAAIRQARSDLYLAQAERRRIYLLTGTMHPKTKAATDVSRARSDLDAARQMARDTVSTPKESDDVNES